MVDIELLRKRVLSRYPLFTATIENLIFICDYSLPTAATNGNVVFYNPKFLESITLNEAVFVMAHEVSHVALNHIPRAKDRDPLKWNIATDAVINAFLERDGLNMPEGCIKFEAALNYSSEELYKLLCDDEDYYKELLNSLGDDTDNTNTSHNKWNSGLGDDTEDNQDSSSGGSLSDDTNEDADSSSVSDDNCSTDASSISINEPEVYNKNKEIREANEKAFKEKLAEAMSKQKSYGSGAGNQIRGVDIGKKSNLIDWRYLLREACNIELDYSYKDATIEDGVLVSRLIEIPTATTEILLDTSGSIENTLLKAFLKECKNILQSSRISVGCFDDKVYPMKEIKSLKDLETMKFQGGGGTSFDKAVKGFSKLADNKIIFTDGFCNLKEPTNDIIWVVFGTTDYLKGCKKVIKVDKKALLKNHIE